MSIAEPTPAARIRTRTLVALLVVAPLTFALKHWDGPLAWWANNWGSSFGYEIFFMLVAFLLMPRRRAIVPVAGAVCAATVALEFLQLWQPPWLQAVRSTAPGAALLGNTFEWSDLPAYPLGCLLGVPLLRWLGRDGAPS